MPYHVAKSAKCPAGKPWAAIKTADGEVMGCHATEADADSQLAALYANEADRGRMARTGEMPGRARGGVMPPGRGR